MSAEEKPSEKILRDADEEIRASGLEKASRCLQVMLLSQRDKTKALGNLTNDITMFLKVVDEEGPEVAATKFSHYHYNR